MSHSVFPYETLVLVGFDVISLFLTIFGTTLAYTGFLVLARDSVSGTALIVAGIICIVKPVYGAFLYFKSNFGSFHTIKSSGRGRKDHLRLVRSDDDKPTLH